MKRTAYRLLGEILRKFCWCFSRFDKRSFSLLPKAKAICCEATAGNLSLSWVGKKEKLKFGRSQATPI
jgi:hypothetical protein